MEFFDRFLYPLVTKQAGLPYEPAKVEKSETFPNRGINKHVSQYIRSLPDLTGKVVVDIPCGDGRSSYGFKEKGATVRAFDLYPEFMKVDGLGAQYADLMGTIPMEDSSADFLLCQEGIEHISDKIGLFREFNRVLKKGGTLIITTPSISHMRARLTMLCSESELWKRVAPTELDSVWFSEKESDKIYFGHLFLVGVQHLQTVCTLSGFDVLTRLKTDRSNTASVLTVIFYPLLALVSLASYFKYRKKIQHVDENRRNAILWNRVKLNLSLTVLLYKYVFWVMKKDNEIPDVIADLKALTRNS